MVVQVVGYYREPFCRERVVTQGDTLLPTIFNVVVDVVVRHWEYLVGERSKGVSSDDNVDTSQKAERKIWERDNRQRQAEEGRASLKKKATFFNADDGLVDSTYPGWLQSAFYMLTGIFGRVGLRTNVCKIVGMVCKPFRAARVRVDEAYTQQIMREERGFKERQR